MDVDNKSHVSFANLKRIANFDLKLGIPDYLLADMIEQCKMTSAPESADMGIHNIVGRLAGCPDDSESNYVPDTDQEDVEYVTESQFIKFMKKFK